VREAKKSHFLILLIVLFGILLVWSAINPKEYLLWFLEVAPALVGVGICIFLYFRQAFTSTTYFWCFIAAGIMAIGAHYSYSEVPLFDQIKVAFNFERNNFDKVGHFVQGIVSVLISLEVLIRNKHIASFKLTNFLSVCVAMTVAAAYELMEWSAILLSTETTENFLGMQGYIWDAQSDMFFALLGALGTLLFSRRMRRAIEKSAQSS
jgi:putative membrane protein